MAQGNGKKKVHVIKDVESGRNVEKVGLNENYFETQKIFCNE